MDNSKTCAEYFLFFKNSVGLVSHSDSGELDSVNLVSLCYVGVECKSSKLCYVGVVFMAQWKQPLNCGLHCWGKKWGVSSKTSPFTPHENAVSVAQKFL